MALALVASCSDGHHTSAVINTGSGCMLSSDCQDPLVCTAGRCHAQCAQSRDCEFGQRCVKLGENSSVCQLQVEARCAYNSDCTSPLVCAVDLQCRSQCQADRDCTKGQICTPVTRVCAEISEVSTAKELVPLSAVASFPDGGSSNTEAGAGPAVDASVAPGNPDAPGTVVVGPVEGFANAWKPVMVADAGVVVLNAVDAGDAGGLTVLAIPGQAPSASPVGSDPPRILLLAGRIVDSLLQLSISYQANNAIASTLVMPNQASYFTRVLSGQPKTPSHPLQFSLTLALPANLAQLAADGLALPVMIALEDSLGHVSRYVSLNLSFAKPEAGAGLVSSASSGKVCAWDQPATCLPDGTGMLVCSVDEMSVKVVDCPTGPSSYRCVNGADGGAATCECPNTCAAESKTCGKDLCGHDCGTCASGSECDPLGNCRPRAKGGCADGTREAFPDMVRYPTIAGCEVWWQGDPSLRTPRTGQEWCGNSTGLECKSPADACAPGWHLCMQSGWPADIRDRMTYPGDAGSAKMTDVDCTDTGADGRWFVAASSSAYPVAQGGSCSAFPLGCYAEDVSGYMDTVACGRATANSGCKSAVFPNTYGVGPFCGAMSIKRTDQSGVLCCQDPELTGS